MHLSLPYMDCIKTTQQCMNIVHDSGNINDDNDNALQLFLLQQRHYSVSLGLRLKHVLYSSVYGPEHNTLYNRFNLIYHSNRLYITSGLWCQKQVSQARISHCIPQHTVGCNYLFLPNIPASDTKVLISALCMPWFSILYNLSCTVSYSWNFKTSAYLYMCHNINKPYISWQLNLFWVQCWHIIKAHLEMYIAQVCDHSHHSTRCSI